MDDDDHAAAATDLAPNFPPLSQQLAASPPALLVENAPSTGGETLAVYPGMVAAVAGDGEEDLAADEQVPAAAKAVPQEAASAAADEQVRDAAEAVPEEATCAAVGEAHEDEYRLLGDANPALEGDAAQEYSLDDGSHIPQVSLGVDDVVREGTGVSDALEAVPATPDIVVGGDGDGETLDGEGEKAYEDAKAGDDDMVVEELAGNEEESNPAVVTKADGPKEDAVVGLQLYEIKVAVDDPVEVDAAQVDDDSDAASIRGRDSFDDQIGQEIGGGTHDDADEAAHCEHDVQDDRPRMDKDAAAGDDLEEAQDEEGAQMDAVAMTVLDDAEELVKAGDDVAVEGTEMDTLVPTGDDNRDERVGTAGDAATDEEGKQMDAVAMTRGDNEEKETDAAGVDATDNEDTLMDTVALTGDGNEEKEVTAGDGGADEEGMQMDAVTTTGDEDEEDGMASENVAEEGDIVPEEAEVDTAGNSIPEEEAAQMENDDDDEPPPLMTRKGGGRRKRGRPSSKAQAVVKLSVKKKDDEEVCFICFDGGELVVCDRRGCPKAYHPSCVNRDDEFFKSKGRWNCGWHICSNCQKPAHHMCYTCTYSLCKGCIKETRFICVRGNKGFCETCMNTVMLIENKEEATEQMDGVDFDDKSSWWYLFKDYWLDLKEKLSLTFEDIAAAKSQKNGSSLVIRDNELMEPADTNDEANSDSSSGRHLESNSSKKRGRKRSKNAANEDSSRGKESARKSTKRGLSGSRDAQSSTGRKVRKLSRRASSNQPKESESVGTSTSSAEEVSWASKELMDFIAHMRNGDKSMLSQFDVQALLLEYIKRNNLRDPRRKSQIVCDSLLQSLFGKPRVGHFEMLKLLESHFIMNEVSQIDTDDNHGGVVDPDPSQDADGNSEASIVMSSEKRRKSRKYDQRALQTNLDDYAAIDNRNISLMYLRRNLMEELIGDVDTFDEKVLGSFVRIRISGAGQRQDIYRLVQIIGTGRAAEKYKCGKKTTDLTLEILNLDKREVITIDTLSNQEFTEEECKRLRQSIKCGLIPRLTVGEVQEKARVLQAVKVHDWIESEKLRLGHLRDRASDMGHRKELRECVEKLQLLSTPEERARRLNKEPEIHADPTMDPDYESPEEQEQDTERNSFNKSRGPFFRKDSNAVSPGKGESRNAAQRDPKTNWESNRNTWAESTVHMESPPSRRSTFSSHGESAGYTCKSEFSNVGANTTKMEATGNTPRGLSGVSSETLAANVVSGSAPALQSTVSESEKIWQYKDPSGKVQGPFSIVQLRKWNSSGYFPPSLNIWKATEKQDDSILLTDALVGKFEKDLPPWEPPLGSSSQTDKTYSRSNSDGGARTRSGSLLEESTKAGEQTPKSVAPNRSQSFSGRVGQKHDYDTTNLGSTMVQSDAQGYYGMQNSQAAYASQQSLTGSWNAPSGQFGTIVNPATLSQPVMGGLSVGQNIAVVGNIGQVTPLPASMTGSTAVVNSQLPSQNQIASVFPQREERLADGSESKLGEDASDGRITSSGEDLGPVGAQRGAAQSSTQQLEAPADTRNQSNSMMPSQLTPTPSVEPVQPSPTTITSGDNQSSGWAIPAQAPNTSGQAQVAGNMNWGAALQGNAGMGWGMLGQTNMNMSWGTPAQGAASYNMGLTMPTQPNVVPNMGWVTPNPGNTNMNMIWATTQGQGTPNAAAMMGAQMQGVAMAPWGGIAQGNANSYPGWGAQVGNMNQNVSWGAPGQGNAVPNSGNGAGQGNNNMNWNSPNPNWNNQQRDNGGRHPGHSDDFSGSDPSGRSWRSQSGGDGGSWGPRRGVCKFFVDTGYCKKGDQCNYFHPPSTDGHPLRNDRHFDRQHSSNERRYDRHNERNDRQFDRQTSGSERHYDRHDDRHSDRDNDRHDDRQADRPQSREAR